MEKEDAVSTENNIKIQEENRIPNKMKATGIFLFACGICYGCICHDMLSIRNEILFGYLEILFALAWIDWDRKKIYDDFHIAILLLSIFHICLFPEHGMADRLVGALIVSVPMLILTLIIPGAFGGGDIKLMAVSGWLLGKTSVICAMICGLFTGAIYGGWMLKTKKLKKKDHFAFGPFLAIGLAVAALWGDEIVEWYLQWSA